MKPTGTSLPKLYPVRNYTITTPVRGALYTVCKFFGIFFQLLIQHIPTFDYLTLRRSPSPYPAPQWARIKIGIRFFFRNLFYPAFYPYLALQLRPKEIETNPIVCRHFFAFVAIVICVKLKPTI